MRQRLSPNGEIGISVVSHLAFGVGSLLHVLGAQVGRVSQLYPAPARSGAHEGAHLTLNDLVGEQGVVDRRQLGVHQAFLPPLLQLLQRRLAARVGGGLDGAAVGLQVVVHLVDAVAVEDQTSAAPVDERLTAPAEGDRVVLTVAVEVAGGVGAQDRLELIPGVLIQPSHVGAGSRRGRQVLKGVGVQCARSETVVPLLHPVQPHLRQIAAAVLVVYTTRDSVVLVARAGNQAVEPRAGAQVVHGLHVVGHVLLDHRPGNGSEGALEVPLQPVGTQVYMASGCSSAATRRVFCSVSL